MKKIQSLFKRNYDGDRLVRDEVVEGSEWVLRSEGSPTEKLDGTACLIRDGKLYKRYDRKLNKAAHRRKRSGSTGPWSQSDFKPAPAEWEPCEPEPNQHTGHWPGWLPVSDGPEDKWYREAWSTLKALHGDLPIVDGTYELIGPKVQGNPYHLDGHRLERHGDRPVFRMHQSFDGIRAALVTLPIEGIVWHHPDGRMVKIKRRDFGLPWPVMG